MTNNASIRHLRCFVAVAEERAFSRAAERLGMTHSALSASIQGAEAAMSLRLFHRTTRRVELTEAGQAFLPVAQRLLRDFDSAIADVQAAAKGEGGHVGIATATSVMASVLVPAITSFARRHPKVRLTIRDGASSEVQNRVLTGDAELGFTSRWRDDPALGFQPLLRDAFGLVVREGHPLAAEAGHAQWGMLAPWPYVALTLDAGTRVILQERSLLGAPLHEVSTFAMLSSLLAISEGFAIVPALFSGLPVARGLVFRPLRDPVITREICIIMRRGRELSHGAALLLSHIRQSMLQVTFPAGVQIV